MHWTAFLAYRRFPANARIADDVACIQCGYNLRGLMVSARCPECGSEAGNSVFLLAAPEVAARGIRTAAKSYLAALLLLVICLLPSFGMMTLISGAMTIGAIFRVWGTTDLVRNAHVVRLPVLGTRLRAWWIASIIDLVVAGGWLASILVMARNPNLLRAGNAPIVLWFMLACWAVHLASIWFAGRFGYALVDMLGYQWTRVVFRVQRIASSAALALAPVGVVVIVIGGAAGASSTLVYITLLLLGLMTAGVVLEGALAMLNAANVAAASGETWDEAVDSGRIEMRSDDERHGPEPPPIPVD